ncbi:Ger(x)C family spore germination protein [Paenibacillus jilunlii]|uniref:Germination protein, Ger(X)C family n=1 Tax=Paenibacillus jilunlii TaxID=682956 RepID=A0A1G9KIQ7_9BACL|nr:Ger(x)C family spore germination protein [Paenibacillus jilunlii]KWX69928.1 spore gernimation protein GerC [Paenibacillus jilunlii]SDL49325.1 germination protein, Ger(x)C family [Paenibacillus jilunlii]
MRRIRRTAGSLLCICLLLLNTGCWDNRDINHRSLPLVMGIAYHENLYQIVLQIPEPLESGISLKILTQTGKTINQAVDKISARMESSVDLLHLKVILVEKEYAQLGLSDSITTFMRSREISPKALVVICDEKLDTFFEHVKVSMAPKGTTLYDSFEKNAGWNPQMALTRIWQVYRSIHSYTRDVAIPVYKSGKSGTIDYTGSAIIKNGRMVGQITPEETLLFNSVNGLGTQGKIEVMNNASVLILSNSTRHRSRLVHNIPYLDIELTLKVSIVETKGTPTTKLIKDELQEVLLQRFEHLFDKILASKADILGVGQYFRNKLPRSELSHWRTDYLPRMKVKLKVNPVIQNEGNLKLS